MRQASRRTVIYCRVFTGDQDCSRQEQDLTAFAKGAGYQVIDVFKEISLETKGRCIRREVVMELAKCRLIDCILVSEMTRWGRSVVDLLDTLSLLQTWGVKIVAQTGLNFDFSTPGGKILSTVLKSLSAFERDLLKERAKLGMVKARACGKHVGRPKGKPSSRLFPAIQSLRSQGKPVRSIARELNISPTTVQSLIKHLEGIG